MTLSTQELLASYRRDRAYHDRIRQQEVLAMALKPKPKQQGIPLGGSFDAIADKMGKMKIKPKRKAPGQTLNQVYAKANKKRFKGVAK